MSPDDPFADRDPQSWNLYSYVRNSLLTNTDEDGHTCQTNSSEGILTMMDGAAASLSTAWEGFWRDGRTTPVCR